MTDDALKAAVREVWDEFFGATSNLTIEKLTSALARRGVVVDCAEELHSDDICANQFVKEMKEKLAQKRKEGRYGWHGARPEVLGRMLFDHLEKGDMIDIANFAMFIWHVCGHEKFPLSMPTETVAERGPDNCSRVAPPESPAPKPARKVVHFAEDDAGITALCNDGSFWRWHRRSDHWRLCDMTRIPEFDLPHVGGER
jgi:hypothetical protein